MAAELIQFPVAAQPVPETTGEQRKVSVKNGYSRMANELIEKLACTKLGGREFRLLCVVIRKTYGYSKKEDWISLSQMADMANLDKANCSRLVDGLVKRRILTIRKRGHDRLLGINTQIDQWTDGKKAVVKNDSKYCQKRQQTRKNDNHNRHINNKDNLKDSVTTQDETTPIEQSVTDNHFREAKEMVASDKPKTRSLKFTAEDRQFAQYMAERIDAVNGLTDKRRNLDNWASQLRLMREADERSPEDIAMVFNWANQDHFWQSNIQSPDKLRKQFIRLYGECRKSSRFGASSHENHRANGQQHTSQQEYIDDISWMEEL